MLSVNTYLGHVGVELHEELIGRHSAVDVDRAELDPAIGFHRLHHLLGLERRRFEPRAHHVCLRVWFDRSVSGEDERNFSL